MPFSNPITAGTILVQPAIQSPNFNQGAMTGWAIKADGSAFFYNITATGTITGGTFVGVHFTINSAGAFFYSGTPAAGNLAASIAPAFGTDAFGNAYKAGFTSYLASAQEFVNVFGNEIQFGSGNPSSLISTSALLGLISDALTVSQRPAVQLSSPLAHFLGGTNLTLYGESNDGIAPQQAFLGITGSAPVTSQFLEVAGSAGIVVSSATGNALTITNNSVSTGNPNMQLTGTTAIDNMLGIEISTDTNNRLKVNASGLFQWGSGSAGQDARLYRAAAGALAADTILANVSGGAETWHTLGTLAGTTVNTGQFRFLADGMVAVEIDLTFAVTTTVPITFSVTIPPAYRPLGSVDVRVPMAQTNSAGGIARIFVGSAGGSSPGQVQIAAFGNSVIGTYSAHFQYPVI